VQGESSYSKRYDLNADGMITIADVLSVVQKYGFICSATSQIPFVITTTTSKSYVLSNQPAGLSYKWEVCLPGCGGTNNYYATGNAVSDSTGKVSFSWTGISYAVVAFDNDCGTFCVVAGTPRQVSGTSTTLTNLYPNRNYSWVVCWPDCSKTKLQQGTFKSGPCNGVANYSVLLTNSGTNTNVGGEVFNLSGTSNTFVDLNSSTPYDFYVYSPSGDHLRLYYKGTVTSNSTAATATEASWQDALHQWVQETRSSQGLSQTIVIKPLMVQAARTRAHEADILFSHTRPDGRSGQTALTDCGITTNGWGEVIERNWNSDSTAFDQAISDWTNSPGHMDVILSNWEVDEIDVGAGAVKNPDGSNTFVIEFTAL